MHILLYSLWLVILITLAYALMHQRYVQAYIKAHRLDPVKDNPQKTLTPWEGQRRALVVVDWLGERQEDPALERLRGRAVLATVLVICWGIGGFIVQVLWMLSWMLS